ncbi:DUF3105 domain-containing protein [Rubrobacter xylanophilus]|uniref:DUF3105 domain-containing protein n=1 Tax=Rubrobacter xylanophilus TaxID=49319 RepID=UPI001F304A14|nr:DUF3105 domain-containing protein [Rubrobacter xylanophilus]
MGKIRREPRRSRGGTNAVYLVAGGIILALIVAFAVFAVLDSRRGGGEIAGVRSYDVGPGNRHAQGDVDYEQTPPAGGVHSPVWQNCGFYDEPVREENAVHSLEHGAVWITYRPDLPREQVERLRELAQSQTYILVSSYPELPAPVFASAWGKQLRLDSANDERLEQFVRAYRQGPQTPEPGAACTGGVGEPS